MFDSELAAIYGVTTGNLNQAVSRNSEVKQMKALPSAALVSDRSEA
jgi:hypothetical protein